jgi:hypothetical protein
MVRYFFDVQNDGVFHSDTEGTELEDTTAAGVEAIQALAELALDVLPGSTGKSLTMIVRDQDGQHSFELELIFRFTPARGNAER